MDGYIVGVFGADPGVKTRFEESVAGPSDAQTMSAFHRRDSGKVVYLVGGLGFPDRIEGYALVASICDHAYFLFPRAGQLSPQDGELALLMETFRMPGRVEIVDSLAGATEVFIAFRRWSLASHTVEIRSGESSAIDLAWLGKTGQPTPNGALLLIDKTYDLKGVGSFVQAFTLSGITRPGDKLRCVGTSPETFVEVRSIHVEGESIDSAGKGLLVLLSVTGEGAKDLERTKWLDDGSFMLSQKVTFALTRNMFYKQELDGRDLHMQIPGKLVPARLSREGSLYSASLAETVPVWDGMRMAVIDLNGKSPMGRNLRIAAGAVAMIPDGGI